MSAPLKVALIQQPPAFLDLPGCLELLVQYAEAAAAAGARLLVFGETWLPGYPVFLDICPEVGLWDHEPAKAVFTRMRQNSLVIGSEECEQIAALAARLQVVLVLGIQERVAAGPGHGTLYNSVLCFDADGRLSNHHRKLVPTYTEKLVWGPGDAAGLRAVDTALGRIGAMVCWEHWMPLARQAMHDSGEQIHIALWPTVKEMSLLVSRQYAFEGRCFVLAVGSSLSAAQLPAELPTAAELGPEDPVLSGGSAVIGPDGSLLGAPADASGQIVYAELDLSRIDAESMTLDTSGHYARPDLFALHVDRSRPGA